MALELVCHEQSYGLASRHPAIGDSFHLDPLTDALTASDYRLIPLSVKKVKSDPLLAWEQSARFKVTATNELCLSILNTI